MKLHRRTSLFSILPWRSVFFYRFFLVWRCLSFCLSFQNTNNFLFWTSQPYFHFSAPEDDVSWSCILVGSWESTVGIFGTYCEFFNPQCKLRYHCYSASAVGHTRSSRINLVLLPLETNQYSARWVEFGSLENLNFYSIGRRGTKRIERGWWRRDNGRSCTFEFFIYFIFDLNIPTSNLLWLKFTTQFSWYPLR